MTNPNDLISRKEIEKMMQEVHDSFENEPIDIKIFARAWLKIARDKLSQIESVNGWIAFDDETPKDWTDIVCTDFTSYATAEVDDWDLIFEYECDIEFTHYMPLHPPPIFNKV